MYSVEGISRNDNFGEFDEELLNLKEQISEELGNLKEQISENSDIETTAKTYGIPHEVTKEYINILKDFYAP